ncbi:hypothetical protein MUU72_01325 [Streptomyces sp. RS10V-4]|uniref:hypothetical protein n=1 Tax=Streptomyces rhizoryzae TaxID=2932493 RepID=UPI002002D18A|nr:hypothetical protein [Streptomyces rhizoryzae]MCK7621781.1 hypothetical protein [Streptomyces rhizoryzae]
MHVEQPHDPFEDRLSDALHQVGGTFAADRAALADAGAARGRRLRLRRRAALAAGAAGVLCAGAGGAWLVSADGSPTASRAAAVAAGPHAATPSGGVTKEELIRTLEKLLPRGTFSSEEGRGTDQDGPTLPYASVVYDDGKGPAALSVSLGIAEPGRGQDTPERTRCPDRAYVTYDACAAERLADGSILRVFQGYEYPDRRADTKRWTADLVTPAGQSISVQEWNAAAEKGAPDSRTEPPLSPAQLKTLVTAPEWRRLAEALPAGLRKRAERPAPLKDGAGARLAATLTGLLPKGLTVVGKSDDVRDPEFTYVVVDDGKGRSLVQINVQPDMRDAAGDLFRSGTETLADGTRIAVHQGPGEKGGDGVVRWTVDTMRADGKRVVISAFNAPTQSGAATRPTPALTLRQLRTIALAPSWWPTP